MQKDSRIFDDLAKMATGATSMMMDMKREVEAMVLAQMEKILGRMNLVKREEFEVAQEMLSKARENQQNLENRLREIEKRLDSQEPAGKSSKK